MGRRNKQRDAGGGGSIDWESERTMAAAEEDEAQSESASDTSCVCGGTDFVLEAYLHVSNGRVKPEPVEVGAMTCPECGREFEPVQVGESRFLRGEFRGYADLEE